MSNGFVVDAGQQFGWGRKRKLSFQLTPTGVRYFEIWKSEIGSKMLRDISTQYRMLQTYIVGREMKVSTLDMVRDKLMAHATMFYPELCVPTSSTRVREDVFAWAAFPMLGAAMRESDMRPPFAVNLQVASGLRALSVREMTTQIFGESPRQLQAAVSQSLLKDIGGTNMVNTDNLTLASIFRGFLPPNALAEVLTMDIGRGNRFQQMDKTASNAIRLLMRRFRPQRIMRLIQSFSDSTRAGDILLRDAAMQYANARRDHPDVVMDLGRQFKTIDELHETITREFKKLRDADVPISYYAELAEKLDGIALPDGAKLIRPSSTHELIDWAADNAMRNCIYAYGKDAAQHKCLLLAILDASGKMIINIMIRGGNVVQCYGPLNQPVENADLLQEVFDGLIYAEIVHPENNFRDWTAARQYRW